MGQYGSSGAWKTCFRSSIRHLLLHLHPSRRSNLQELLALQMVKLFGEIFHEAGLPLWVRHYEVLVTSNKYGSPVAGGRGEL